MRSLKQMQYFRKIALCSQIELCLDQVFPRNPIQEGQSQQLLIQLKTLQRLNLL